MAALEQNPERRHHNLEQHELWERLNLSQKFAARSLSQFGYQLAFIRNPSPQENLVVMLSHDKIATIDDEGDIDITPNIAIR